MYIYILSCPHRQVRGLAKDVVWTDHRQWEEGGTPDGDSGAAVASGNLLALMSKRNAHEVDLDLDSDLSVQLYLYLSISIHISIYVYIY